MKRSPKSDSKSKNKDCQSDSPIQVGEVGIPTLREWLKKTRFIKQDPQIIQDLLSDQPGGYGIIAGRTGIGKTNLAIHLGYCLSTGDEFFKLKCKKVGVAYLAVEGDYQNLRRRLRKIGAGFQGWEDTYHFDYLAVQNPDKMLLEAVEKLVKTPDTKIVILDSAKYFVRGDYLKPSDVKEFIQGYEEILVKLNMSGIITLPISKPQDKKGLIHPGDIYSIKGATEWVDSATFGILLEKKAYSKKEMDEVTLSFAKHRIATRELNDIELLFDRKSCMFTTLIEVHGNHIVTDLDHISDRKHGEEEE